MYQAIPRVVFTHPYVQPREHKAKVCIWGDLTVADVDAICDVGTPDERKR